MLGVEASSAAVPKLAVMAMRLSPGLTTRCYSPRNFSATAITLLRSVWGSRIANSSPPSRPTRSVRRQAFAVATRTASPLRGRVHH